MESKQLKAINSMFINFHVVCLVIIFVFAVIVLLFIVQRLRKYFSVEEKLHRKLKEYVVHSYNESLYEQRYHEDKIHNICVRNEYIIVDKENEHKISITSKGIEVLRILSNNNNNEKLFNEITVALTIMISFLVFFIAYSNWVMQIINTIK